MFREAELSDAIIFFDECESVFTKRSKGGSSELTELLTELERFEGIVLLATNRPFDLDEAMCKCHSSFSVSWHTSSSGLCLKNRPPNSHFPFFSPIYQVSHTVLDMLQIGASLKCLSLSHPRISSVVRSGAW